MEVAGDPMKRGGLRAVTIKLDPDSYRQLEEIAKAMHMSVTATAAMGLEDVIDSLCAKKRAPNEALTRKAAIYIRSVTKIAETEMAKTPERISARDREQNAYQRGYQARLRGEQRAARQILKDGE